MSPWHSSRIFSERRGHSGPVGCRRSRVPAAEPREKPTIAMDRSSLAAERASEPKYGGLPRTVAPGAPGKSERGRRGAWCSTVTRDTVWRWVEAMRPRFSLEKYGRFEAGSGILRGGLHRVAFVAFGATRGPAPRPAGHGVRSDFVTHRSRRNPGILPGSSRIPDRSSSTERDESSG